MEEFWLKVLFHKLLVLYKDMHIQLVFYYLFCFSPMLLFMGCCNQNYQEFD